MDRARFGCGASDSLKCENARRDENPLGESLSDSYEERPGD